MTWLVEVNPGATIAVIVARPSWLARKLLGRREVCYALSRASASADYWHYTNTGRQLTEARSLDAKLLSLLEGQPVEPLPRAALEG